MQDNQNTTQKKNKYTLVSIVLILMLLSFATGVLASGYLLKVNDNINGTAIEIMTGDSASGSSSGGNVNGGNADGSDGQSSGGLSADGSGNAHKVTVSDDENGLWTKTMSIELFKTSYANESGEITVQSANGDAVIAPGTSNKYSFDIKNMGDLPVGYTVETNAEMSFNAGNGDLEVPIEVRFYTEDGQYLIGTENSFGTLEQFETLSAKGELTESCGTSYILEWRWPFEGNDELDTMLGSLSALAGSTGGSSSDSTEVSGSEAVTEMTVDLKVSAGITVIAYEDPNAVGGTPITGDIANIGLWVGVFVVAAFALVMLLFARRKDKDEE